MLSDELQIVIEVITMNYLLSSASSSELHLQSFTKCISNWSISAEFLDYLTDWFLTSSILQQAYKVFLAELNEFLDSEFYNSYKHHYLTHQKKSEKEKQRQKNKNKNSDTEVKSELSSENSLDFRDDSSFTSDSSEEECWDFKDTESMTDILRNNLRISDTMSMN